jgi:hypothetical protein
VRNLLPQNCNQNECVNDRGRKGGRQLFIQKPDLCSPDLPRVIEFRHVSIAPRENVILEAIEQKDNP